MDLGRLYRPYPLVSCRRFLKNVPTISQRHQKKMIENNSKVDSAYNQLMVWSAA